MKEYLFSAFKRKAGDRHSGTHLSIILGLKYLIFWDKWVPEEPVPVPHTKR